jgi:hypothetical protein
MPIADSPLKDRVLFIEGAPRSGTTWLNALCAAHPEIAGIVVESHFFDNGIGQLFRNHEGYSGSGTGLAPFVSREEFVDLVRDLCDGILLGMHRRTKPDARYVVEKSPLGEALAAHEALVQRKLECYPDAWYLHIVREGRAVAASLMRAPFTQDRSPEACLGHWRSVVDAIRAVLGGQPRFREIRYEDLRADPAATSAGIFDWLGLERDDAVLDRIRLLSQESYAVFEASEGERPQLRAHEYLRAAGAGYIRTARAGLGRRLRSAAAKSAPTEGGKLANAFADAFRAGDDEAMRALTTDDLVLELRSGRGDFREVGEGARVALGAVSREVFGRGNMSEVWSMAEGTPFHTILVSARGADATRTDLSVHLVPGDGKVARLVLLSPAPLPGGAPSRERPPAAG